MSDLKVCLNQLRLLLWKNYSLQKRSIIGTILELAVPAFFAIILLPIRGIVKSNDHPNETYYGSFSPSQWPNDFPRPTPPKLPNFTADFQWDIGYTPKDNPLINDLMANLISNLNIQSQSSGGFNPAIGFSTEEEMIANLTNVEEYYHAFGGIVFLNTSIFNFTYKIRLHYSPLNPHETGYVKISIKLLANKNFFF